MSIFHNSALIGASGQSTGYRIERSLRFNSADSAYLSRTAGTPTSSGTWTFSVWVKRAKLGSDTAIFGGRSGGAASQVYFKSDNTIRWYENGADFSTTAVFRDVSSWYHFVFTKNGSSSCTIYVNGVQLQQNTASVPSTSVFNASSAELFIGAIGLLPSGIAFYGDHYLTEIHFVDGQALTPSSFAETNATTGQWVPKAYSGTYGTNGFRLNFSDNSAATATTLGKDRAGSNNWTPNNLSVTAGAGNDSLVDTPTSYGTDTGAGGEVRGNYCTFSPITVSSQTIATLNNGNLDISAASGGVYFGALSTFALSTGKWYWEYIVTTLGSSSVSGITPTASIRGANPSNYGFAEVTDSRIRSVTGVQGNATNLVTGLSTVVNGDVIGVAVDFDAGKIWFRRNGTWDSSGNPAAGTNATSTFTAGREYYLMAQGYGTWAGSLNTGQRPFAYTAPSGFKALCDTNLPAPVVAKPSTAMDVVTYTGTGASRSITGLNFSPDWVWIKSRSNGAYHHRLVDTVRGATKEIYSNLTNAEGTDPVGLTDFNSDGFTLGSSNEYNASGQTFVGWTWDAGSSTVTNTQGSITSQVRANASAGFSIVTYTGTGANATIGHGLGVAPQMIIAKRRNAVQDWVVYHKSAGVVGTLFLNLASSFVPTSNVWDSTLNTSSVFQIYTASEINSSGGTYVAYCFAPVAGYSSFGSYTGNGSADGPFVFCNFRPRWVMIKRATGDADDWQIRDTSRSPYNTMQETLFANLSNAEATLTDRNTDNLSNGFKLRGTDPENNASGATYIYAAFAESPFQYARAR